MYHKRLHNASCKLNADNPYAIYRANHTNLGSLPPPVSCQLAYSPSTSRVLAQPPPTATNRHLSVTLFSTFINASLNNERWYGPCLQFPFHRQFLLELALLLLIYPAYFASKAYTSLFVWRSTHHDSLLPTFHTPVVSGDQSAPSTERISVLSRKFSGPCCPETSSWSAVHCIFFAIPSFHTK